MPYASQHVAVQPPPPGRVPPTRPPLIKRLAARFWVVAVLIFVVGVGVISYNLVPALWTYSRGTETTAKVERCQEEHHSGNHGVHYTTITCYGAWTLDDQRHSGQIRDPSDEIRAGTTVPVRATETSATVA